MSTVFSVLLLLYTSARLCALTHEDNTSKRTHKSDCAVSYDIPSVCVCEIGVCVLKRLRYPTHTRFTSSARLNTFTRAPVPENSWSVQYRCRNWDRLRIANMLQQFRATLTVYSKVTTEIAAKHTVNVNDGRNKRGTSAATHCHCYSKETRVRNKIPTASLPPQNRDRLINARSSGD